MNLFNLIGATLLTVSPILNEPKNIERPDNVIMERVDYLDYGIIATSYIYDVSGDKNFVIDFKNNHNFNLSFHFDNEISSGNAFIYLVSSQNLITYELTNESYEDKLIYFNELNYDNYFRLISSDWDGICTATLFNLSGFAEDFLEIPNTDISYYEDLNSNQYVKLIDRNYLSTNSLYRYYVDKYLLEKESAFITDNIFDVVGVLLVFSFGIGIVKFGFNLIKSLLRL